MSGCEVWDVVKVPFPYTNRPIHQYRPSLVIASSDAAGSTESPGPRLLWVLMITSAEHRTWPGDVAITDLEHAGLPAASVVRTTKIATVEDGMAESIGSLGLAERGLVTDAVERLFTEAGIRMRRES